MLLVVLGLQLEYTCFPFMRGVDYILDWTFSSLVQVFKRDLCGM